MAEASQSEGHDVSLVEKALFPNGTEFDQDKLKLLYDQYKIVTSSADQLAARRQAINGFFLSLNTFVLAGIGYIFKESFEVFMQQHRVTNLMMLTLVLSLIGFLIDKNWAALIESYGNLVRSQIPIIEAMERHMVSAPLTAQSATHRNELYALADLERHIAYTFQGIYVLCGIGAVVLLALHARVATH